MSMNPSWGEKYSESQTENVNKPILSSIAAEHAAENFVNLLESQVKDFHPLPDNETLRLQGMDEVRQYLKAAFLSVLAKKADVLGPPQAQARVQTSQAY